MLWTTVMHIKVYEIAGHYVIYGTKHLDETCL